MRRVLTITAVSRPGPRSPGLPVLVLSQHVETLDARELPADRSGGVGYLLKEGVSTPSSSSTRWTGSPRVAPGAVSKDTTNAFDKLGISDDTDTNRRVLAVLTYLNEPPSC